MKVLLYLCGITGILADESLLKNGGFDRDLATWSFWFAPGQADGKAELVQREGGGALQVNIRRKDNVSSVQVYQGPFKVRRGQLYRVRFLARAVKQGLMRVSLIGHTPPYGGLGLSAEVPLTTEWKPYVLNATALRDSDNARIDFFPPHTTLLDEVHVEKSARPPEFIAPESVKLAGQWNGNPMNLSDGKPGTSVTTAGYPRRPLFAVADLGKQRSVQQVVIETHDLGRHMYVSALEVEVSKDGKVWHEWSRVRRQGASNPVEKKHVTFHASSMVVPARFVRIRLSSFRWLARLTDIRIAVDADTAGGDLAVLPVVDPVRDLCFLGWNYERLGYAVSPGEQVEFRWANQGTTIANVKVNWELTTYDRQAEAEGSGEMNVPPAEEGTLAVQLPDGLKDGPKFLQFKLGGNAVTAKMPFYFDYRAAAGNSLLALKVVALLDNDDAEGWARMLAGPLAMHITAFRDWPAKLVVDAALVQAEGWQDSDHRVRKLKSYLQGGGKAIVYGKPAPGLADVVPVVAASENPFDPVARSFQPADLPCLKGLDSSKGPRHYRVKVSAKPGTQTLASWDDGSPAVVEGSFGKGKVIYVSTGSGQVWSDRPEMSGADELSLRMLYRIAGRDGAFEAALETARSTAARLTAARRDAATRVCGALGIERPERFAVLSHRNVGRFGWLTNAAGMVENISETGEMRSPGDPKAPWSVQLRDSQPLRPSTVSQTWLSKTVALGGEGKERLRWTASLASPGILWEGKERTIQLPVRGVTHLAFPTGTGVRVLPTSEGAVLLHEMKANWLVLLNASDKVRDVPKLIVFTRRPKKLGAGQALTFEFDAGGFGALFTSRVFGVRRFGSGETARWVELFPSEAAEAAGFWGRAFLRYPVACDEIAWQEANDIIVADRFDYRTFEDDWDTTAITLAPLPPVLALAKKAGAPLNLPQGTVDTGLATKYGPLHAVRDGHVLYRIPLPPTDHFGVIPVKGKMALQEDIDTFALHGISKVTRASGGLTSHTEYMEDLRTYMSSTRYPPFEAPCIDLYKWWYCFPALSARPAYTAEARATVDGHYREHYWRTLNFYPHKCFVRYRREPGTNIDYAISFIWPAVIQNGVRYFIDQNESSAVIAYCYDAWARYYGDWDTLRSNWNLCRRLWDYLPKFHDWAWMASSNHEAFGTAGIDMLNSEYPGNLAFSRAARQVGDADGELLALVLAAKALVPAVARFAMPEYIRDITADGDPWREFRFFHSFHKSGIRGSKTIEMRGGPFHIMDIAIGMLNTAKGTSPELALAYKSWIPAAIEAYERSLADEERKRNRFVGWSHLMQRSVLGWPRDRVLQGAEQFHEKQRPVGWRATMGPHLLAMICVSDTPLFLADWSPAEYISGAYDLSAQRVLLSLRCPAGEQTNLRLYTQRKPESVTLNQAPLAKRAAPGWNYDAATGWLNVSFSSAGKADVVIQLGSKVAPLHPYFRMKGRGTEQ